MFKSKEEKEILEYIRNGRNDIDQIAELIYNNRESQYDAPEYAPLKISRTIGLSVQKDSYSKASFIVGELIKLYKKVYGNDYELKYPTLK